MHFEASRPWQFSMITTQLKVVVIVTITVIQTVQLITIVGRRQFTLKQFHKPRCGLTRSQRLRLYLWHVLCYGCIVCLRCFLFMSLVLLLYGMYCLLSLKEAQGSRLRSQVLTMTRDAAAHLWHYRVTTCWSANQTMHSIALP